MEASSSVLSQTITSITRTKINELEKQAAVYESRKGNILEAAAKKGDRRERIALLLKGLREVNASGASTHAVSNIRHWLSQSKYDTSVPEHMLQDYEELLRSQLEIPSRKLALAHLYARLVDEWMGIPDNERPSPEEDSFEVVDAQKERLKALCEKFEQVVFEPLETDETAINLYLNNLFKSDQGDESAQLLKGLRDYIGDASRTLFATQSPFDATTLDWCIKGLLAEDLLSDQKQRMLRDFLDNPVVLDEIGDILNIRFLNIGEWEWDSDEDGIPVLPRQQLNGKYRIWMDEDVLQAILIHYIGINCCISLKKALAWFIEAKGTIWRWHSGPQPTMKEWLRRKYYMNGDAFPSKNMDSQRRTEFVSNFFLSQLPATEQSIGERSYDGDGDDQAGDHQNIKQLLLQTIASHGILHKTVEGEVAMIQTDLEWFATGLSHTTIFTTMRFMGFSEEMIAFYKKVLEAPLNVYSSPDTPSKDGPRTRRRGVPIAHATEKLIGELILFILDLAVNQKDGMLLYRLHDDLWLCGRPKDCARGWEALNEAAQILGLEFNKSKTGSAYITEKTRDEKIAKILPQGEVRVGHLRLDSTTGQWKIDHSQVDQHKRQLKKQLSACRSVLEWVQTWNSCMGRFFSHTFGEPAFCFGVDHVDSILETYKEMQEFLISDQQSSDSESQGVVGYLKRMIHDRFGTMDIPDAFLYLPERFGGLGLRNPFISLLTIREDLARTPQSSIIQKFFDSEATTYKVWKQYFDGLGTVDARIASLQKSDNDIRSHAIKGALSTNQFNEFHSMDDMTQYRWTTSAALYTLYNDLRRLPSPWNPKLDPDIRTEINSFNSRMNGRRAETELQWALQMYGDILRQDFGGLRLMNKEHLLLGVLSLLRNKRVRWTMVL